MGTRSVTVFMDGADTICRIYRQMDGYPTGHGLDLARACNRTITHGISGTDYLKRGKGRRAKRTTANGIEELAALVVMDLKLSHPIGGIYLQAPASSIGDWVEYLYVVRASEGKKPTITCTTQTGEWPFNAQQEAKVVFLKVPADKLLKRLAAEKKAEHEERLARLKAEEAKWTAAVVAP